MERAGLTREYAETMTALDVDVSNGVEEAGFTSEKRIVGNTGFADFIDRHKHLWYKSSDL